MFNRHDILIIRPSCRSFAYSEAIRGGSLFGEELMAAVILSDTPAIVKSQENTREGFIEVGFSSHLKFNGMRVRFASVIPLNDIMEIVSPFDVAEHIEACKPEWMRQSIEEVVHLAKKYDLEAGFYGSCALSMLTGKPYITSASDIDICLKRSRPNADIVAFYSAAAEISKRLGVILDIEMLCSDGAWVKLKELLSASKTVLRKGLFGSSIVTKELVNLA